MQDLRAHEKVILEMLFAGEEKVLEQLREQARVAIVSKRTHTGVGEYIDLSVPPATPAVSPSVIILQDIELEVEHVENGAAILLYVVEGRLKFIEIATYVDEWPEIPNVSSARYLREVAAAPGNYALEPVPERDKETLRRALLGREPASAA